ncbi:MAG: hypothetical protein IPG00_08170 [Saprospiraceae bacterium]|nr:hypothetical protein [Saprospiraceae bacterium]
MAVRLIVYGSLPLVKSIEKLAHSSGQSDALPDSVPDGASIDVTFTIV